jgi:hypothetical protein
MKCNYCGQEDELRFGCCWDCASAGEERAAKRTVVQHVAVGFLNLWNRKWDGAKFEFKWALERLTGRGDYAAGGYFDWQGVDWRGR